MDFTEFHSISNPLIYFTNVQCQQVVEKLRLLSLRMRAHSGDGSSNLGFYKSITYRLLRRPASGGTPRHDMQELFQ